MFLAKQALMVEKVCAKDDPSYSLEGIKVESDGSTVATDGHALMKWTPTSHADTAEFPTVDGCDPTSKGDLEPFILPADVARAILKTDPIRKRQSLPILENVALDVAETNANGCAVLAVTDLASPQVFRPMKLEGNFPRYEHIIEGAEGSKRGTVGLRLDLVMGILQTLKKQGCEAFRLTLTARDGQTPADCPVILEGKTTNGKATALVMPYRMD